MTGVKRMKSEIERLLELRKRLKSKKPDFYRHLWWKKPKFANDPKWRKPKGLDNKMRLKLKGYPPVVQAGYRGPALVRGLHPSGLEPVIVHSLSDLEKLDPGKYIVYIGAGVGLKKRVLIEEEAVKRGFKIANPSRR